MNQAIRRKTKWNIIYISSLVIILLIGGTLAYFYDDDYVRTMFVTGEYDSIKVRLIEPEWKSDDQGHNSLPGDNIPADPTIVNVEEPVYMRVAIHLTDLETGKTITGSRADKIWSMVHYVDETGRGQMREPLTETEMKNLPWINSAEFTYDDIRSDIGKGIYYFNYTGGTGNNHCILDTDQQAVLYNYVIVPIDWNEKDIQEVGNFVVNIQGEAIHSWNYELGLEEPIKTPEQAFDLIHETMKK